MWERLESPNTHMYVLKLLGNYLHWFRTRFPTVDLLTIVDPIVLFCHRSTVQIHIQTQHPHIQICVWCSSISGISHYSPLVSTFKSSNSRWFVYVFHLRTPWAIEDLNTGPLCSRGLRIPNFHHQLAHPDTQELNYHVLLEVRNVHRTSTCTSSNFTSPKHPTTKPWPCAMLAFAGHSFRY